MHIGIQLNDFPGNGSGDPRPDTTDDLDEETSAVKNAGKAVLGLSGMCLERWHDKGWYSFFIERFVKKKSKE